MREEGEDGGEEGGGGGGVVVGVGWRWWWQDDEFEVGAVAEEGFEGGERGSGVGGEGEVQVRERGRGSVVEVVFCEAGDEAEGEEGGEGDVVVEVV